MRNMKPAELLKLIDKSYIGTWLEEYVEDAPSTKGTVERVDGKVLVVRHHRYQNEMRYVSFKGVESVAVAELGTRLCVKWTQQYRSGDADIIMYVGNK